MIQRGELRKNFRIVYAQAGNKPPETLIKPPDDGPRSCSIHDLKFKDLASAVAVYLRLIITMAQ
jgi:hypothetical protein